MHRIAALVFASLVSAAVMAQAQRGSAPRDAGTVTVIRPARVFDGESMHEGWAVRVRGDRIEAAGTAASVTAAGAATVLNAHTFSVASELPAASLAAVDTRARYVVP